MLFAFDGVSMPCYALTLFVDLRKTKTDEIPEGNFKSLAKEIDLKSNRIAIFKGFTLEGKFVKEFFNLKSAADFVGLKRSNKIKNVFIKN